MRLEGAPAFEPERDRPPVGRAADLETHDDDYLPKPPEPVEWTADRAAAVLQGGFAVARWVDPVARQDEGRELELWRMDRADAIEAGEPLARMMNRYAPVRTLAGFADEAELGLTLGPILAEQMRRRGAALRAIEGRILAEQGVGSGPFEGAEAAPPPPADPVAVGPFPPAPPPDAA